MVFTTIARFVRSRGPDEFWRKRRIFKLAAVSDLIILIHGNISAKFLLLQHFQGRKRNCYSIAVRYVHRALAFATKGRRLKKEDMANVRLKKFNCVYYRVHK